MPSRPAALLGTVALGIALRQPLTMHTYEQGNYFDQTNMTLQLCAAVLRRKEMLTSGEIGLTQDLIRLIELEVDFYASLGLSHERQYWQVLQKKMREILSQK